MTVIAAVVVLLGVGTAGLCYGIRLGRRQSYARGYHAAIGDGWVQFDHHHKTEGP